MIRNLLLTGGVSHDFDVTAPVLAGVLAENPACGSVESTIVSSPDAAFAALRSAQMGECPPWDLVTVYALWWRMPDDRYAPLRAEWSYEAAPDDLALLHDHVDRGGALLALHTAVICFDAAPAWADLVGATWNWERSGHPPLGPVEAAVTAHGSAHPVSAGVHDFTVIDELYGNLDGAPTEPLLSAQHGETTQPLLWTRSVGRGRVVVDLLGHDTRSLSHPSHRRVLQQATAWAVQAQ